MIGLGLNLYPRSGGSGALTLLGTETQGLAIDFTDLSMVIRDTGTPANVFSGDPNSKLTYSSPSTKWVLGANGLYSSGTTLRTSYNASGTALGVLIEEARTNLLLQSQELDNASWVKVQTSITANAATSPDGTVTADLLASTANSTFCYMYQGVTLNISTTYTVSFFAKYSTCRWLACLGETSANAFVYFDIQNGVVGTAQLGASGTITSVGNGWYYCTATFPKSSATASEQIGFMVATADNGTTATIGLDAYIWQAQIEAGAFATSPIVTAGATVTRVADNAFLLTTAMPYNASAGTYFVNGSTIDSAAATSGYSGVDNNGAGTNYMLVRRLGSAAGATVLSGGVTSASFNTGTYYSGAAQVKSAVSGTANLFKWAVNGASPIADDTSGAMPVGIQRLNVGALGPSFGFWNGHIKQILYLPRAMDTAELQALTT